MMKPPITEPIIVVEDDIDDQFLLKKVFDRLGVQAELIFFSNGKDAFQHLITTEKDTFLILCDINMPIMNGLELRAKINEDQTLREKSIPFIFLSTAARPIDVITAYDMTVQGFFLKESTLEGMEESLRCILSYWSKCKHPNAVRRSMGK